MKLSWNRAEDGVVTVYATASDGRVVEIADFWLKPLVDKFGMDRQDAKWMQQNFAENLVSLYSKHFTEQPTGNQK